jgi:hypothetical protein
MQPPLAHFHSTFARDSIIMLLVSSAQGVEHYGKGNEEGCEEETGREEGQKEVVAIRQIAGESSEAAAARCAAASCFLGS